MNRRPRSAILACVLGLVVPGLGHLYVGRAARFGIAAILCLAGLAALALLGALSTFAGYVALITALAALYLFSIVDPPLLARRIETFAPKWYNRWYGYAAWVVVVILFNGVFPEAREPVLGYGTYRLPSAIMAPAIASGEIVLADTRAYRSRAPAIGDVVVVRGPSSGILFVRRVAMARDASSRLLVTDDPMGGGVPELAGVSADHLVGQVTYVLYSPTWNRIGRRVE